MRAYRITFDESTSKFVIEIQGFAGLYWKKAKVTEFRGENDEFRVTKSFDTYQKARNYVKDIGLDQVYEDFTLQKPYGTPASLPTRMPSPPPRYPSGEILGRATVNIPYPAFNKEHAA